MREGKRGAIPKDKLPVLAHIGIDPKNWRVLTLKFESLFKSLAGEKGRLRKAASSLGYTRAPGARASEIYFQ